MTGNRVEQLESRVRELEATLNGLTDELVDTKDRLETVEGTLADGNATNRRTDIVEGELLGEDEDMDEANEEADAAERNDSDRSAETGEDVSEESRESENGEDTDGIIVA